MKLWQDFKSFALKGNMIDLAVAVIIGNAFGAVVTSLVKNIIMPSLSYVTPGSDNYRAWMLGRVEIGQFLGELVNFLIVALAMFLIVVKLLSLFTKRQPAPVTTKDCPYCLSKIPLAATRCAQCTSQLPAMI